MTGYDTGIVNKVIKLSQNSSIKYRFYFTKYQKFKYMSRQKSQFKKKMGRRCDRNIFMPIQSVTELQ